MAPVALNVAPGLRPWRQAGVAHLLVDAPLAEALRVAAKSVPVGLTLDAASSSEPQPGNRAAVSVARPMSGSEDSRRRPDAAASRQDAATAGQDAAAVRVKPESARAAWAADWQSLWEQMSASGARPAAVWSYAELGADVRGQADAERRRALQSLIADLRLPKGSHAFWPYCLPPDNTPNPEMFLAGLNRFKPGLVLLAGAQAAVDLAVLGPLPSVSLQLAACRGIRFMLLPTVAEIAGLVGSRREQLLAFIKAAVA